MSFPAVTADLRQATGRVSLEGKPLGTAIVISADHVATAAHVIGDDERHLLHATVFKLTFPDGPREFRARADWVDWAMDIAVLERVDREVPLPPPVPVRPLAAARPGSVQPAWVAWGFPPDINRHGFGLAGNVVADAALLAKDVPALQLTVVQNASHHLGGVSGGPVIVDGYCVALIREYPLAVENGTLYATPLAAGRHIAPLGAALRTGERHLPDALRAILRNQLRILPRLQASPAGQGTSQAVGYVQPELLDDQLGKVALADVTASIATGGLVLAGAGVGKTRLLAELLHLEAQRLEHGSGDVFYLPMLIHWPDMLRPGSDLAERLAQQTRYPLLDKEGLQGLLKKGEWKVLFLVDAIDEAATSKTRKEQSDNLLTVLDDFCQQFGHKWLGTCRSNRESVLPQPLPSGIRRIILSPFDEDRAEQLVSGMSDLPGSGTLRALNVQNHAAIFSNPMMLLLSARTRSMRGTSPIGTSPTEVLRDFFDMKFEAKSEVVLEQRAGSPLEKALRGMSALEIAGAYARAEMEGHEPIEAAAEKVCESSGLSAHQADRAVAELVSSFLVDTAIQQTLEDGTNVWSHELYRDYLVAAGLVEQIRRQPEALERLLAPGRDRRWQTSVVMAMAMLPPHKYDSVTLLMPFNDVGGLPVCVEYLCMGGTLPDAALEKLFEGLEDMVHSEQHLAGRCSTGLSDSFKAFDALLSLAFLPGARDRLQLLTDNNIALHSTLKRKLDSVLKAHGGAP